MSFSRWCVALLSSAILGGCDGDIWRAREIDHPIVDSLNANPRTAVEIRRNSLPADSLVRDRLGQFVEQYAARRSLAEIGKLDGPGAETLGFVIDVTMSPDGSEIFVLDGGAFNVSVFGADGRYLYSIGGPGDGPGEFRIPEAVLLVSPDRLVVTDRFERIHRFGRGRDGRFVYLDREIIGTLPRDACVFQPGFILHSVSGDEMEVLHRFEKSGHPSHAFAVPYRYSRYRPRATVSRGQVACSEDLGLVFLAFWVRSAVEAYRVDDGSLAWHARLDGMMPSKIVEVKGGSAVRTGVFDSPEVHYLERASGGTRTVVTLQYVKILRDDFLAQNRRHTLETYVLDPETGEGQYLGDSIPRIMYLSERRMITLKNDPYPRLEVFEMPLPARENRR
jgi:6-bladed beta-propeller